MNNRGFFLNQLDEAHVWHPFALPYSNNILIKKAKGIYLFDVNNKKYMDAVSSWWVNLHGHNNIRLKNALTKQFRKTDHIIFSGFTHEPGIRLAKKLNDLTHNKFQSVYYSDNGSTAVEIALKAGIQFLHQQGSKKINILSFENAYHGDTFGAMSGAGKNIFNMAFRDFLFSSIQLPLPSVQNIESILQQVNDLKEENKAFVFIYEPLIQGAGGMNIYCKESLAKLIAALKKQGAICIADEVMTGFYRTGTFLAGEQIEKIDKSAVPDIVCLSKGITGGIMPLGATLLKKELVDSFANKSITERFYHGHSYTGNALACAIALENLHMLDAKCLENVNRIEIKHEQFEKKLQSFSSVKNIAVCGTILRFEIVSANETGYAHALRNKIYDYFIGKGILLRPLGNVIYIMPPYVISDKELKKIYSEIESFLVSKLET